MIRMLHEETKTCLALLGVYPFVLVHTACSNSLSIRLPKSGGGATRMSVDRAITCSSPANKTLTPAYGRA